MDKLEGIKVQLADSSVNPMQVKKYLGEVVVDMYYPAGSGEAARQEFERVFSDRQLPEDMPELTAADVEKMDLTPKAIYLVHLMTRAKMTKSNGEARRLIQSGSVSLNGDKVGDPDFEFPLDREYVLKVGKRRYLRLKS
jgi:tyrosyl-tRNA synthetase